MTASALPSPTLSESHKAQTKDLAHSQTMAQSTHFQDTNASGSCHSSASSSPHMQSTQVSHPIHHMFTATSQQPNHHHIQILGNHPPSPVACTFLDLPADPFMPTRANLLFSESEYEGEYQEPVYEAEAFLPYSTAPAAEDCQASADYMYPQRVKSEFPNDNFASLGSLSASMGPSYMMTMSRSFSDGQLSDICGDASANMTSFGSALQGQVSLNQATGVKDMDMCESPLGYNSHIVYDDDYYTSAQQHNLYSHHHSQSLQHGHHHSHSHSYSTSSLSTLSEESSMSPRSPFSSNSSLSMSSSCSSITSAYPLSRTLSESAVPFLGVMTSPSNTASATTPGAPTIRPTPKRSRGRRVSCNPDNSGCKVFTCRFEDCGKIFKRSEHLKRHVRSIHTMEKPFECPIHNCPKRFSRSDNLNQHIRIHRHNGRGEKSKSFAAFTPFLQNYPTDLLSLS